MPEVRQEVAQQSVKVAQLCHSVDAMAADLAQSRVQGIPRASAPQARPTSPSFSPKARRTSHSNAIDTPRTDHAREKVVLVIWPWKMAPDHYKATRPDILIDCLTDSEADRVEPNFPKAASHVQTHVEAARFRAAFKAKPFSYRQVEMGDTISIRASCPTTFDQQARGRSFKPIYAAMDTADLQGHLKLSCPRGSQPVTVVPVGLTDGRLEDIAKVFFSDFSESCRVFKIDFGPLLKARPHI